MNQRIKQWLKKRQERRQVQALRSQWLQMAMVDKLCLLPLDMALKRQLRALEDCEEAAPERTALSLDHPKLWTRIKRKIACGRSCNAHSEASQLRYQALLARRVRLKRRLALWSACQGLKLCRLILGSRKM